MNEGHKDTAARYAAIGKLLNLVQCSVSHIRETQGQLTALDIKFQQRLQESLSRLEAVVSSLEKIDAKLAAVEAKVDLATAPSGKRGGPVS